MSALIKSKLNCVTLFCDPKFLVFCHFKECRRLLLVSHSYNKAKDKPDVETILVEENDNSEETERKIERIRDKSRLRAAHRNVLYGQKPYSEPKAQYHLTLQFHRKMFGKYGIGSGMNPGVAWPTKSDLELQREYESVAYPFTIQEMVQSANKDLELREQEFQQQHDLVLKNMKKLDLWKTELKEKLIKREAEATAAKEKKEKLIEEVRRHFGFKVDPKDERFKEMLVVKEKEQKKKEKRAKQEEREKKAISKLMSKYDFNVTEPSQLDNK